MTEMNFSASAVAGLAGLAALTNVLRPASGAGVSFFAKASSRYWTTSFGDLFARTVACARAATGSAIIGASTDATAERRAKRLPAVDDHTRHGISALSHSHPGHSILSQAMAQNDDTRLADLMPHLQAPGAWRTCRCEKTTSACAVSTPQPGRGQAKNPTRLPERTQTRLLSRALLARSRKLRNTLSLKGGTLLQRQRGASATIFTAPISRDVVKVVYFVKASFFTFVVIPVSPPYPPCDLRSLL